MQRLWFRAKTYGWGWTPVTWEGWLSTLVLILLLVWNAQYFASHLPPSQTQAIWFFVRIILIVAAMFYLCYKTGEKPGWRWGKK